MKFQNYGPICYRKQFYSKKPYGSGKSYY
ncbi:hypothetical protein C5167_043780 [Papaver somniferum]|uniref:Uncharacterized protein n=1 Tax=Papaver somniferum TaxID=3469 RepID=A0A4Y7L6Q0_PAPSO|nr:hypothetical protein C5167_043780 [Papaver somniferum]